MGSVGLHAGHLHLVLSFSSTDPTTHRTDEEMEGSAPCSVPHGQWGLCPPQHSSLRNEGGARRTG